MVMIYMRMISNMVMNVMNKMNDDE